jgi:hypothetical protein
LNDSELVERATELRDKAFAQRLNSACDGHPHIPAYGQGRQTWVKEKLDVSHEAVRKWFTGESRPRPDKMKILAMNLEVDEAWLALGITPDQTPREKKARDATAEGAVNVVTGLLQMNGATCAFPAEQDPASGYVNVYAIMRGVQLAIHVSLAKKLGDNQWKFIIPKEYEQCRVLGAIHVRPNRLHLVSMDHDMIDRYRVRKGGFFEIVASYHDNHYWSGGDKWPRIESFARDL